MLFSIELLFWSPAQGTTFTFLKFKHGDLQIAIVAMTSMFQIASLQNTAVTALTTLNQSLKLSYRTLLCMCNIQAATKM